VSRPSQFLTISHGWRIHGVVDHVCVRSPHTSHRSGVLPVAFDVARHREIGRSQAAIYERVANNHKGGFYDQETFPDRW
jgi:hypothetical protein